MRLSHSLQTFLSFSPILDILFNASKNVSPNTKKVSSNEDEKEGERKSNL